MTLLQKVQKVKEVLKDEKRFFILNTPQNKWIYDSYTFQFFCIRQDLLKE